MPSLSFNAALKSARAPHIYPTRKKAREDIARYIEIRIIGCLHSTRVQDSAETSRRPHLVDCDSAQDYAA